MQAYNEFDAAFDAHLDYLAEGPPEDPDTARLTYWSDPGHGWLEVPFETMKRAGLSPQHVSIYSYVGKADRDQGDGTAFYLEEDCDLALFMAAANRSGLTVKIDERQDDGRVRRMRNWDDCRLTTAQYRKLVSEAYQ